MANLTMPDMHEFTVIVIYMYLLQIWVFLTMMSYIRQLILRGQRVVWCMYDRHVEHSMNVRMLIYQSDELNRENIHMDRRSFHKLCLLLQTSGNLQSTKNTCIKEMVARFLNICGHSEKDRSMKRQFVRSKETISRQFGLVLNSVLHLHDMSVPFYKVGDALEFLDRAITMTIRQSAKMCWFLSTKLGMHSSFLIERWRCIQSGFCPHRFFNVPVKTMVYPEAGFEHRQQQGDTSYAQMYIDIGIWYAPAPILRGEEFDGVDAIHQLEMWLIQNHEFQVPYAVSELTEKNFWRIFDGSLYEHCRNKYGAVGTFMSVYYKSKKGNKIEKEVAEAEVAFLESSYAEAD